MLAEQLISFLRGKEADSALLRLYPARHLAAQKQRYIALTEEFARRYGADRELSLFSVTGRTELSGNHTDHNRGLVLCGSVSLDIIAVVSPREDTLVHLKSEGFPEDTVDLAAFSSPAPSRFGRSDALIAGVADGMRRRGYRTGGFDACTASDVLKGSGLSSSAAFEDMVGLIFSELYNGGKVDHLTVAQISQYAENAYFGKPCGLMDQIACAFGGVVSVDFADTEHPAVTQFDFSPIAKDYDFCVVNTGGNHADLTDDYAAIPAEMKSVAAAFGKTALRDVPEADFRAALPSLREACGDRAVLRAAHFYAENRRVAAQKAALAADNIPEYFRLVLESGRSSCMFLQNAFSAKAPREQGLTLALCLCEEFVSGLHKPAAYRLQGGGFAGTVQAYIPKEDTAAFAERMSSVFGKDAVLVLSIRPLGAVRVL